MYIFKVAFYLLSTSTLFHFTHAAEGNGNLNSMRNTPNDEVIPIPYFLPPVYIDDRIKLLIRLFFMDSKDQAEAQELLQTIWYYNPVYAMLAMVDQMSRMQYAYAEYGDECFIDAHGDESQARIDQQIGDISMGKPSPVSAGPYFFTLDSWWEILENTVQHLWRENMIVASKICDYRGRRLMCAPNSEGELRCSCPTTSNGVQLVGKRGGICGIQTGNTCDYHSGTRLESLMHLTEVLNKGESQKACFGNSFCTGDRFSNETKCHCWPNMNIEERSKRTVLFNTSVGGAECENNDSSENLKWGKWNVTLSIVWMSIFLVIVLIPQWDDLHYRVFPGYYRHYFVSKRSHLPKKVQRESHSIKMDPKVKEFIEKNAVTVDVNDPNYYELVDAVDRADLGPFERFIDVPQCINQSCSFEWPTVHKYEAWF